MYHKERNAEFLEFIASFKTFLDHQNAILLGKGSLNRDNILAYQTDLLEELNNRLPDISADPLVLEEINQLHKSIKLNTHLKQAQSLQRQERIDDLKSKLLALTTKKDKQETCH